jgi:hypothetical protein
MIVYTCVSDQRGLEIILYMYGSRTFSTSTTIVRDGYTNNDIIYVVFLYLKKLESDTGIMFIRRTEIYKYRSRI